MNRPAPSGPPAARSPRVLIIDDSAGVRVALRMLLVQEGCEVREAAGGEEGLALARDTQPDLIFLDVVMPNIDGLETLRRLRGDPDTRDLTVFMLTVLNERDTVLKARRLGVEHYLLKPFDYADLRARLDQALGTDRYRRPPDHDERPAALVVDDEAAVREVFGAALIAAGWRVETALDGRDAYRKLRAAEYALMVCDLQMPDWDGLTVIESLPVAQIETRVLVVSAFVTAAREARLRAVPQVAGIAHKPITPPELAARAAAALGAPAAA